MEIGPGPQHNDTQLCHGNAVSPAKNGLASFSFVPCQAPVNPYSFSIKKQKDGLWHFHAEATDVTGDFTFLPGSQSAFTAPYPFSGEEIKYQQLTVPDNTFATSQF